MESEKRAGCEAEGAVWTPVDPAPQPHKRSKTASECGNSANNTCSANRPGLHMLRRARRLWTGPRSCGWEPLRLRPDTVFNHFLRKFGWLRRSRPCGYLPPWYIPSSEVGGVGRVLNSFFWRASRKTTIDTTKIKTHDTTLSLQPKRRPLSRGPSCVSGPSL